MMAEAAPSTPNQNQAVSSYEWRLRNGGVRRSRHILRLRWQAWEPLSSIRVLDDAEDINSPQQRYIDGSHTHPIAGEPLTKPPVSSIDLHVASMDLWEEDWLGEHDVHGEWDEDYAIASFGARMVAPAPGDAEWALVEMMAEDAGTDPGADDFEIPATRRLHCSGQDRPPKRPPCVTLRASTNGGVVTIGDWITCVHEMLEQQRPAILASRGQKYASCGEPVILEDEVVYVNPTNSCAGIYLEGERDVGLRLEMPAQPPAGWESFWNASAYEARRRAAPPPPTAPKMEPKVPVDFNMLLERRAKDRMAYSTYGGGVSVWTL
ncbi:hypothetical protein CPLU01_12744 [Colletotrichum plurivorum]|uniref:Uncharacterized protein n=1 Tax=Colletotrichum plurivorum TaxID=2175906 RepID=A0A8H6JWD2_9PEZI|nr:hypothetical protein CPLU01_12744 [Colletotrichum plurivorum]